MWGTAEGSCAFALIICERVSHCCLFPSLNNRFLVEFIFLHNSILTKKLLCKKNKSFFKPGGEQALKTQRKESTGIVSLGFFFFFFFMSPSLFSCLFPNNLNLMALTLVHIQRDKGWEVRKAVKQQIWHRPLFPATRTNTLSCSTLFC